MTILPPAFVRFILTAKPSALLWRLPVGFAVALPPRPRPLSKNRIRAGASPAGGAMNGKTTLPVKAWKAEYAKLTAERETLNRRYLALKGEVKEAEQIRRSVYNILRQEQREQQPRRAQDMER